MGAMVPENEKSKAIRYLKKTIPAKEKRAIRAAFEKDGRDWLLNQHLLLGTSVRNTLRAGGFAWDDITLDGVWAELLLEAVSANPRKASSIPFRRLAAKEIKPYKNAIPLYSLKAAAGKFSETQDVEPEAWVEFKTSHKFREGMFVAQVVGKSMEPAIPDGSYCLFASPVQGTRQGKVLLVQHHAIHDPDTGGSYTVKKYTSKKVVGEEEWKHSTIALHPLNPAYEPITIKAEDSEDLKVIAEWLENLK